MLRTFLNSHNKTKDSIEYISYTQHTGTVRQLNLLAKLIKNSSKECSTPWCIPKTGTHCCTKHSATARAALWKLPLPRMDRAHHICHGTWQQTTETVADVNQTTSALATSATDVSQSEDMRNLLLPGEYIAAYYNTEWNLGKICEVNENDLEILIILCRSMIQSMEKCSSIGHISQMWCGFQRVMLLLVSRGLCRNNYI